MLRCFNPYVYDGYHASPLITVLSDFPHPDLDAFPDDGSIKPIVLASSDLVKLEDWWWPSKLILVACPPVQAFSAHTHHLLYGCGPSGVPVPAPLGVPIPVPLGVPIPVPLGVPAPAPALQSG